MNPSAARLSNGLPADPGTGRGFVSGWTASVALHALLLVVAAFGLKSCTGGGQRGEADADWRAVGLVTRPNESTGTDADASEATEPTTQTAETPFEPTDVTSDSVAPSDEPPTDLARLPGGDLPKTIDPGASTPAFAGAAGGSETSPAGPFGAPPAAPAGLARGETRFLGITDKGESFVYVVDISGSMASHNAIAFAKAELMSSLQALHGDQKFQVVFYNERPHPMRLPGKPAEMYWASDINRTLARQFIAAVDADLGTEHLPALKAALALRPDVIFFLTDAKDLSAKDRDAVTRLNAGAARIHAVEFGTGPKLEDDSSLERLARDNGGAYQYRDVSRLRR